MSKPYGLDVPTSNHLLSPPAQSGVAARLQPAADAGLQEVIDRAKRLAPLETLIIARQGEVIAERGYRGHRTTTPTNIKSASKSVIATLVGIAIDKGVLEGVD